MSDNPKAAGLMNIFEVGQTVQNVSNGAHKKGEHVTITEVVKSTGVGVMGDYARPPVYYRFTNGNSAWHSQLKALDS